ncbi:MAG: rod shape-determining protein MreD [Calditrichota bacterium]
MNRLHILYGVLFFVAILLQSTLVKFMDIGNIRPDLILIALVIFSLNYGAVAGSTAGFFIGIISDLISGNVLGFGSLAKSITGYIAGGGAGLFKDGSRFVVPLIVSCLVHDLVLFGVRNFDQPISWRVVMWFQILPTLGYTTILGLSVYLLIGNSLKRDEEATY